MGMIQVNSPASFCAWLGSDSAWNSDLKVVPVVRGAVDVQMFQGHK